MKKAFRVVTGIELTFAKIKERHSLYRRFLF